VGNNNIIMVRSRKYRSHVGFVQQTDQITSRVGCSTTTTWHFCDSWHNRVGQVISHENIKWSKWQRRSNWGHEWWVPCVGDSRPICYSLKTRL